MNIPGAPNPGTVLAMAGKFEKMKIQSLRDASFNDQLDEMEALINTETYTFDYKLKVTADQPTGNSKAQLKYLQTSPSEMTFEFLFDCTGIIDGNKRDNITDDIIKMRKIMLDFDGTGHQPPYIKLVWGTETGLFKGRLTALSINYKLFNADGSPLRAVAKATFKESIQEEERAALEKKNSPDLTHVRIVKEGDTLPLMCAKIYGDPKYYFDVARINKLNQFRKLIPGMELIFPPIGKQKSNTMHEEGLNENSLS